MRASKSAIATFVGSEIIDWKLSYEDPLAFAFVPQIVNSDHVDPLFWDVDPPAKQAIK